MSTLDQMRNRFNDAWRQVTEGWQHLRTKASHALTYFKPHARRGEVETADVQVLHESSRWGLVSADVWTTDDAVIVSMEVPGMNKDDFDILVIDHYLVVRGTKRVRREGTRGHYHTLECAYGEFERAVALPEDIDQQRAKAGYSEGVLRITLPKSPSRRKRRITVEHS